MLKIVSNRELRTIRQLPQAEMVMAFTQLSRFLSAGVLLVDALDDISENAIRRVGRHFWMGVGRSVAGGKNLSEALACSGIRVENAVIAMIKSGEANGQLDSACQLISEYLRWHYELRQRIITLLVYPLFSLCVVSVVVGFLFVSVVPSMKGFLLSTGDNLEWHTQALLDVSGWFSEYFFRLVFTSICLVVALFLLVISNTGMRCFIDKCVLKIPLFGSLLTDLLLSRYARCCAQLYSSGIALESSLQLAEESVGNRALRSELASVRVKMIAGASLAQALSDVSALPSMFTRLVAVGERSGQLSDVLVQLAEQQNSAVEASISRMEQLIGPVLLLCVGSVLLWIVVSMLGPVYDMAIATVIGAS